MVTKQEAQEAMEALLQELPFEFCLPRSGAHRSRGQFTVTKERNVSAVHDAITTIQEYINGH